MKTFDPMPPDSDVPTNNCSEHCGKLLREEKEKIHAASKVCKKDLGLASLKHLFVFGISCAPAVG